MHVKRLFWSIQYHWQDATLKNDWWTTNQSRPDPRYPRVDTASHELLMPNWPTNWSCVGEVYGLTFNVSSLTAELLTSLVLLSAVDHNYFAIPAPQIRRTSPFKVWQPRLSLAQPVQTMELGWSEKVRVQSNHWGLWKPLSELFRDLYIYCCQNSCDLRGRFSALFLMWSYEVNIGRYLFSVHC